MNKNLKSISILTVVLVAMFFVKIELNKTVLSDKTKENSKCKFVCFEGEIESYRIKHKECGCVTVDEANSHYNIYLGE